MVVKKVLVNTFHGALKQHQAQAVNFLLATPKALLADDVGLGKTIEAIAYITELKDDGEFAGDETARYSELVKIQGTVQRPLGCRTYLQRPQV